VALHKNKGHLGQKARHSADIESRLGMVDGMLNLLPMAKVGHIGLYRDPKHWSLLNITASCPVDAGSEIVVLDPMLPPAVLHQQQ
jgi:uracil phosphoribosyltransferase